MRKMRLQGMKIIKKIILLLSKVAKNLMINNKIINLGNFLKTNKLK